MYYLVYTIRLLGCPNRYLLVAEFRCSVQGYESSLCSTAMISRVRWNALVVAILRLVELGIAVGAMPLALRTTVYSRKPLVGLQVAAETSMWDHRLQCSILQQVTSIERPHQLSLWGPGALID